MKISTYENIYYRFKDGKPYLIGSRCRFCSYVAFPKKVVCPACVTKGSMEEIELSSKGRIDTFSVLHVGAPGFSVPYIVAYVVLPEGPRVFSMINGCEPSEKSLEVGTDVELIIGKIHDDEQGNEIIGYKFRPIRGNPR